MPFALNEATRFISPTKTPEYLAAGVPVVSTPIADVVRPYGDKGLRRRSPRCADAVRAQARELLLERPQGRLACEVDRHPRRRLLGPDLGRHARADARRAGRGRPRRARQASRRRDRAGGMTAMYDYLIVGAGFAGSVLAERLARVRDERVLVVDRRPHIGGNAYDRRDEAGILIHQYGPHIFHTNAQRDLRLPVAVHRSGAPTSTACWPGRRAAGADPDQPRHGQPALRPEPRPPRQLEALLRRRAPSRSTRSARRRTWWSARSAANSTRSSSAATPASSGGWTRRELDKSVTARVPTRTNRDDRYFTDTFQAMPQHGYTRMFERMLDHPNIQVMTRTDYRDVQGRHAAPAR